MFPLVWEPNNEWWVKAGFVGVAFAAWKDASVVAEVEDDCVVVDAIFFEFADELADLVVDNGHAAEVLGVAVADDRGVWVMWRDRGGFD